MGNVPDRDGVKLTVGAKVTVVDNWNPAAMESGIGEVTEIQENPHHAVLVKFPNGKDHWVLAGLTVVEIPEGQTVILRDKKEVARVPDGEVGRWFLKHQPMSMDWAIKHEGYSTKSAEGTK